MSGRRPSGSDLTFESEADRSITDMELLELQPTTTVEARHRSPGSGGSSSGGKATGLSIPKVCKFAYCELCAQVMPPRAEHCDACNQCTLRVDHHCVWIGNNCVGLLNHKFFLLFLLYINVFFVQIMGPFIKLLFLGVDEDSQAEQTGEEEQVHLESGNLGALELLANYPNEFVVYALCNALLLGIGFMLLYQIVILCMNKTTMEVSMDAKRSPFRKKGPLKNIEIVFGSRKLTWLSPFHDPFPEIKLIGYTPVTTNSNSSTNKSIIGQDYLQFILPTVRTS